MSPTARVNAVKQLKDFQEYNTKLQSEANKKLELQNKATEAQAKAQAEKDKKEKEEKENQNDFNRS